ncbi:uncharacterized protein FIBRA_01175 [Fibroporia radiculosa]|uniref:Uncharacterized protein n=1 Tax=Fibroporia radiculosa TaxID=599839 RepID=J4GJH5_9APHY|nr:uncharacterized protein FIBRA_01175 [Fibroporia radiculosa]CCL99160.1 predicted protein [Fibroporia radiculosa]
MAMDISVYRREPTAEDVLFANAQIKEHESAISAIEGHIASLHAEINDLRREQRQHEQTIRHCKGIATLARRIPEELLSKIFEHCVEDGYTRAPIIVSHVCSAWRKAALAPRVWSHVYVNCDAFGGLARTRFWLSMVRQAPLDITVLCGWNPNWQVTDLMDLLMQHIDQWRTLVIESSTFSQVYRLLLPIVEASAAVPNLREVRVDIAAPFDEPVNEDEADVQSLSRAFAPEKAPRLSRVQFRCDVVPLLPVFPSHITDLSLSVGNSPIQRPLSASSLMTILSGVPSLYTLAIQMPLLYERPFVPSDDPARTVSLPVLTSLTLYGPTNLNEFLPHLHTPVLQRLHLRSLEDAGYRQEPVGPSLLRFLAESTPPLELLELHDIDLTPGAFASAFRALPYLRELRLHESSISDATVQLLHGGGDGEGLCPRLTRLDLRWCGHLNGRALVELVQSRKVDVNPDAMVVDGSTPNADPISEVAVIHCCFVKEQDVLDLAAMTVCRLIMREEDDYCRSMDCCTNVRYRIRLRLKHLPHSSTGWASRFRLII